VRNSTAPIAQNLSQSVSETFSCALRPMAVKNAVGVCTTPAHREGQSAWPAGRWRQHAPRFGGTGRVADALVNARAAVAAEQDACAVARYAPRAEPAVRSAPSMLRSRESARAVT
jgi:hypothetical protein